MSRQTTRRRFLVLTGAAAAGRKSMGNCMAVGHAAGVAAAIAATRDIVPRQVDAAEIRAALRAHGVSFDPEDRNQLDL